jgi:adenine-specific DNA-methyltransferase
MMFGIISGRRRLTTEIKKTTMSSMRVRAKQPHRPKVRYQVVTKKKASGATYTPQVLADFVARQICAAAASLEPGKTIRVLDPAVGDGELLMSLLGQLHKRPGLHLEVHGFETDPRALETARGRLQQHFPLAAVRLRQGSFLEFVLQRTAVGGLFAKPDAERFDLIIANPPYVRTQIMGAEQAQLLARQFALGGRVDLYHAFLLGMAEVLNPRGTAGVIVSNRFMTTKSGASVRRILRESMDILHVWDLGDTKLFEAAILPAVLLLQGKNGRAAETTRFISIYQTTLAASSQTVDPMAAVLEEGVVAVADGRCFEVRHGELDSRGQSDDIWRIATQAGDSWLATVQENTWGTFRDIGKIRVRVKTCADRVFIRDDWDELPARMQPELLRPLMSHHIGRRFRSTKSEKPKHIVYPHEVVNGCRAAADLRTYPRTQAYLESHRAALEARQYVIDGGRQWYEIWVPQDPAAWDAPKLVFRDISEEPMFWIDREGSVVNGDCYWLVADHHADERLLWLAVAVANSTFIEEFYDHRFNNKLYAGRRRFMTQYVEQFPLPDPDSVEGQAIIADAIALYDAVESPAAPSMQVNLDLLVRKAFMKKSLKLGRRYPQERVADFNGVVDREPALPNGLDEAPRIGGRRSRHHFLGGGVRSSGTDTPRVLAKTSSVLRVTLRSARSTEPT